MLRAARARAAMVVLLATIAAGCGGGGTGGPAGGDGGGGGGTDTVSSQSDAGATRPTDGTDTSEPGRTASVQATTVTDSTFDAEVLQSGMPVLVHFWAEWCGPCRKLAPDLEELAGEHQDKLALARLNVDDNPDTPARFEIKSLPTLVLFVDGVEKKRLTGSMSKDGVVTGLAEFIG
jgi:thioredoxin 1